VRENFVLDALINFEPVQGFKDKGDMAEARGFRNSSSCRVENKLKAIKLIARKIEKERVTVVDLGMN